MEIPHHIEKFHPQLEGKRLLFVDKSLFTPAFVSHMTGLEKMKIFLFDNLIPIPDLNEYMEKNIIDFAIIHNATLSEIDNIITASQKGKVIIVQEKNDAFEVNIKFNNAMKKAHIKTFPRTNPDPKKALIKCLDYLASLI
jgi:hypothetical protein